MIVGAARDAAVEWGNPEITAEHLLYAAATNEPTRDAIAGLQLDPDQVAEQMKAAAGTGDGSVGTPTLSRRPSAPCAWPSSTPHRPGRATSARRTSCSGSRRRPTPGNKGAGRGTQSALRIVGQAAARQRHPDPRRVRARRDRRRAGRQARPGRRQDGDRGGPGAAHRQRRCAQDAGRPASARPSWPRPWPRRCSATRAG